MPHPLVLQLRFARREFKRAIADVADEEAGRRFPPMNCISWNVGHLAWQEQRYWLWRGQGQVLLPDVQEQFAYGAPASTPALTAIRAAWEAITAAADPWLDALTSVGLQEQQAIAFDGAVVEFTFGSLLLRTIYHYWYHTGENMAIRQLLSQRDLPEFVGNIDDEAPYLPEAGW
jgi:DinB family protein